MSIWVLHQRLTAQEETDIGERTHLSLPFDGLPDLSHIASQLQCRHLVQALHPDEPPEVITTKTERIWTPYSSLHAEDIIVVPLKGSRQMALAQVSGPYEYRVGERGEDCHLIPVTWYPKRLGERTLGKHRNVFEERGEPLYEIMNPQARIAVRDKLPHSYNRFGPWKWLMIIFFIINGIRFVMHLGERL